MQQNVQPSCIYGVRINEKISPKGLRFRNLPRSLSIGTQINPNNTVTNIHKHTIEIAIIRGESSIMIITKINLFITLNFMNF